MRIETEPARHGEVVASHAMKVSPALTRGANVDAQQMQRLAHDGFRSIVSLNLEGDEDAEHAAAAGLKAISLPVLERVLDEAAAFGPLTEEQCAFIRTFAGSRCRC